MTTPVSLPVVIDGVAKQALIHGDHPHAVLARGEWLEVTDDIKPLSITHQPTRCADIVSQVTVAGVTVAHVAEGLLAFDSEMYLRPGQEHTRVRLILATGVVL